MGRKINLRNQAGQRGRVLRMQHLAVHEQGSGEEAEDKDSDASLPLNLPFDASFHHRHTPSVTGEQSLAADSRPLSRPLSLPGASSPPDWVLRHLRVLRWVRVLCHPRVLLWGCILNCKQLVLLWVCVLHCLHALQRVCLLLLAILQPSDQMKRKPHSGSKPSNVTFFACHLVFIS